jgi:hypothetical protein
MKLWKEEAAYRIEKNSIEKVFTVDSGFVTKLKSQPTSTIPYKRSRAPLAEDL